MALREVRSTRGMSIRELANEAGGSPTSVFNVEHEKG
jgi:hypothetical protein